MTKDSIKRWRIQRADFFRASAVRIAAATLEVLPVKRQIFKCRQTSQRAFSNFSIGC